jgi:hypothetical protein
MTSFGGAALTDADREAAAVRLREHYAAGRLTLDEFQERLDGVYKAQTARELSLATDIELYDGQVLSPGAPWGSQLSGYQDLQAAVARVGHRVMLALAVAAAGAALFVALLIVAIVHGGLLGVAAGVLLTVFVIGAAMAGTAVWLARRLWRRSAWGAAAALAAGPPRLSRLLRTLVTTRARWRLRSRLASRA